MWGALELFLLAQATFLRTLKRNSKRNQSCSVYFVINIGYLVEHTDYNITGESRSDSISKIKISPLIRSNELSVGDNMEFVCRRLQI